MSDIQGNRWNPTIGMDVAEALTAYSQRRGILNLPGLWLSPFPPASRIFNLINADRPVILFGRVPDPRPPTFGNKLNHAITITGMERTRPIFAIFGPYSYYYWAHYGWGPAWNDVFVYDTALTRGAIAYY